MVLYPISVVKTRLQVASHDALERNAFSIIKGLMKREGIPGFYKGFGTIITGSIPARMLFAFALERSKVFAFEMVEPLRLSEPTKAAIANGVAGMMASSCSQVFWVPMDVVCCRYFYYMIIFLCVTESILTNEQGCLNIFDLNE